MKLNLYIIKANLDAGRGKIEECGRGVVIAAETPDEAVKLSGFGSLIPHWAVKIGETELPKGEVNI